MTRATMRRVESVQLDLFPTVPQRLPPSNGTPTSNAAAEAIRPSAETLRKAVFNYIASQKQGATDDQIQLALSMNGSTERPRRIELVAAKLIKDSGTTRKTSSGRQATVWITT